MDLTLTEDQELIRSTARELLRSRAGTAGARAVRDTPAGYSTELWKEMVELGWTGLAVPEAYGGVGEGFFEACLLIEEMGAAAVPSPFLHTVACAALPIARFGTEAQRARWLGGIADGRAAGYARGEVTATAGDDRFTLDGSALFVPFADVAEHLLVVARDGGRLVVGVLDTAAPGISREPLDVIGPDRLYRVELAGVEVPADDLLGGSDTGGEVVDAIEAFGAAASCAEMIGGAQRVLEDTVAYAGERQQFGRPIGGFQAVQHHCADMAIDVLGSRFIAYEAIWRLSADVDPPAEVSMAVSLAKSWVSESYQRVCALGHQVHGAIGFTAEHDLHLYTTHATSAALRFGDEEFHTDRVARRLGLPAR